MEGKEISKDKVKKYLKNKRLEEYNVKIKENVEVADFQEKLSDAIVEYSKKPTYENKSKCEKLLKENYSGNDLGNLFKDILKELNLDNFKSSNRSSYTSKTFEEIANVQKNFQSAGLKTPEEIIKEQNNKFKKMQDEKLGIGIEEKENETLKSLEKNNRDKLKKEAEEKVKKSKNRSISKSINDNDSLFKKFKTKVEEFFQSLKEKDNSVIAEQNKDEQEKEENDIEK